MTAPTPARAAATGDQTAPRPRQTAPAKLGRAGRKLWRELTERYDFEAREVAILEAACRQQDNIADLQAHLAEHGMFSTGSTGQTRLSQAVTEVRLARVTLAKLLGELDLPEEQAPDGALDAIEPHRPTTSRSRQARKAANRRWRLDSERRQAAADRIQRRAEIARGEVTP